MKKKSNKIDLIYIKNPTTTFIQFLRIEKFKNKIKNKNNAKKNTKTEKKKEKSYLNLIQSEAEKREKNKFINVVVGFWPFFIMAFYQQFYQRIIKY